MALRKPSMRCRACGRRVTHGLMVCPFCGNPPAQFHTRWQPTLLSLLAGLAIGLAAFGLTPELQSAAILPTATATARAAAVRRPTFTPTATATPLPTATPTNTPTPAPTATPTPTPARQAQNTPTANPTPTPKPLLKPPLLIGPEDQAEYGGGDDAEIILRWEGALQEGQQFAVTVRYINRSDATETRGAWTRDNRWKVDPGIFRGISLGLRALKWDVTIIDASGAALSEPSESRIFYWR